MGRDDEALLSCEAEASGAIRVSCRGWRGFRLDGLAPALALDGAECAATAVRLLPGGSGRSWNAEYRFGGKAVLALSCAAEADGAVLRATLTAAGQAGFVLNRLALLATGALPAGAGPRFGADARRIVALDHRGYAAGVRPLARPDAGGDVTAEAAFGGQKAAEGVRASSLYWAVYDRDARRALLAAFLSSERWAGRIELETDAAGAVIQWSASFDGGDLAVAAGEGISVEPLLLRTGPDPWRLLEDYGERTAGDRRSARKPPVSWCSWYPYRLGVSEERLLATARIAAERLSPLGFSVVEADLGWERDWLPNAFEENAQFPRGLRWLSGELAKLGLVLGVWKAPYSISALDPLAREHPEWLARGGDGKPLSTGDWFWVPHGAVHVLDLTHPGAQGWLREKIRSLRERGIGYFKADFISCAMDPRARGRHDPRVVFGGGTEAARIGARIIREELPDAELLNCGGPLMPGSGQWPLLYLCNDTGNTGFISWRFHRDNFMGLASRLWMNGRWGIIQPSCLCVGLPGTLEEARLRATAAFLAGGQIDISDTLDTLPEDRWQVLTATLPPLGYSARPVDLFDPLPRDPLSTYTGSTTGSGEQVKTGEHPPASVWHLKVDAGWDSWDLAAFFSYTTAEGETSREIDKYSVPLERLGLDPGSKLWGYEFWSRQFLGPVPSMRTNPGGYAHPGDFQDLSCGTGSAIQVAFFGPAVKLVCLRRRREHPWPVGTSFHQSCGEELEEVAWDPGTQTLSGTVRRPAGETGTVAIAPTDRSPLRATVDGKDARFRAGSSGVILVSVTLRADTARWAVEFR